MSKTYTDLIYTQFPDELDDSYEYMQDLNADLVNLAAQYESLINTKKFADAAQLLQDNPTLNRIYFNAEKYNRLIDGIRATQRLYKHDVQTYILELVKYKGEFSTTVKYTKYDVVNYNSITYMCTSLNLPLGTLPTDFDYWTQLTIKGDKGDSGLGLTPRGVWDATTRYYKDDLVSYNAELWVTTEDNIGQTPDSSDLWYCVLSHDLSLESIEIKNEDIDAIFEASS